MVDNIEYRSRHHMLLLYPDNASHMIALNTLRDGYKYCAILHDSDKFIGDDDIPNEGELKKAHYHVIVSFPNAVWNGALSKNLGIESRFIRNCSRLVRNLRYLIHLDNPDKFQYDSALVFGTNVDMFVKAIGNKISEDEQFKQIMELVNSYENMIDIVQLAQDCADIGLYSCFRRSFNLMKYVVMNHNNEVHIRHG